MQLTHRSLGVDVCIDTEMEVYLNLPEVQEALHANKTKLKYDYQQCSEYDPQRPTLLASTITLLLS